MYKLFRIDIKIWGDVGSKLRIFLKIVVVFFELYLIVFNFVDKKHLLGTVSRVLFLELTKLGEGRHRLRRRPGHALDHCAWANMVTILHIC